MFPDLRLLIGALAASVAALCCGFAVFAAFRVSHEPLSRLPATTAPLQLVLNEAAPRPPTWGAPVAGVAPRDVSDVGAAALVRPATSSAAPVAVESGKAFTAAARPTAFVEKPRQHATAPATPTALADLAVPPKQTPPAPAAASVPPAQNQTTPVAQTTDAPPVAPDAVRAPETVPTKSAAALPTPAPTEPSSAAPDNTAKAPPAIMAAIDAAPDQSLPAERPADIDSVRSAAGRHEKPGEAVHPVIVRKAVAKRRLAVKRRVVRKPPAPAGAQFGANTSSFHDPVFRSAPDFQPATAARARSANKTTNSNTVSNSFVWPSAE